MTKSDTAKSGTAQRGTAQARPNIYVWAACFLLGFALITVVGETLPEGMRSELYLWQRTTRLDDTWQPQDRYGHETLYRGDDFLPAMREADVLILGNSRTLFAFRHDTLEDFRQRTGRKVFNLGMAGEGGAFALRLIRRHDLRPKILLINADNFFAPWISIEATELIDREENPPDDWADEGWKARRDALEHAMAGRAHAMIRPWIPRWHGLLPSAGIPRSVYRSLNDGSWYLAGFDAIDKRYRVPESVQFTEIPDLDDAEDEPSAFNTEELEVIEEYRREMEERGTRIVLTHVPHQRDGDTLRLRAIRVAEILGAPLILPRLDDLQTFDHSHLEIDSGLRFGEAVLTELERISAQ